MFSFYIQVKIRQTNRYKVPKVVLNEYSQDLKTSNFRVFAMPYSHQKVLKVTVDEYSQDLKASNCPVLAMSHTQQRLEYQTQET